MIAIDLTSAEHTKAVVAHCLHESNLIIMSTGAAGVTIRFMPPLTVSADEIDLALHALERAFASLDV